jgi:5'-3' exoribonuclease 1
MLSTAYRINVLLSGTVTMVQDSGGVPHSMKGVVIGLNTTSMDVAWDIPFISDVVMGNRCSFSPSLVCR